MGKLFKFLMLVALVAVLAGGGSYAGAYFAQGKIVGVEDPLGQRTVKLYWQGYDSLPGKPKVWIFRYSGGKVTGIPSAMIIVSLSGKVLKTKPADLDERIERWRDARQSAD
jgi:YD repeat-containing protein